MTDEQELNQPAAKMPQAEPTMKTSLIAGLAMAYSAMGAEKLFEITEYLRNPLAQQHLQWLAEFIHSQTRQAIRRVEDVHDIADSLNILDAQCVVIDHLLAMAHMTPEMLGTDLSGTDTDLGTNTDDSGSGSVSEEKAESGTESGPESGPEPEQESEGRDPESEPYCINII